MQSRATTVAEYLEGLPPDRQSAIKAVRAVIRKNLPQGFVEQMQYGMIGYVVPHQLYPAGYHAKPSDPVPFASLASQKNYMSLYLMTISEDDGTAAWFEEQFALRGKKLNKGQSCIRFKRLEDLPLDVIGEVIAKIPLAEYIQRYESRLKR